MRAQTHNLRKQSDGREQSERDKPSLAAQQRRDRLRRCALRENRGRRRRELRVKEKKSRTAIVSSGQQGYGHDRGGLEMAEEGFSPEVVGGRGWGRKGGKVTGRI
ncbi:hypothetical protein LX36DRAFT_660961 [Colletotrichum falcatum]|nr:hypothetical protein LX36DRAFT_660961 [Colletotrichum falcatum]